MQTIFSSNKLVKFFALCLALVTSSAHAAPILQFDNGELIGAKHVMVAGTAYNVAFRDGTCDTLNNFCTQFPFSQSEAMTASAALFNQVFLDLGPAKEYDSNPAMTRGCDYQFECQVWTLFKSSNPSNIMGMVALNHKFQAGDFVVLGYTERSFNFAPTNQTLAVWTPANAVPEPGSVALLGIAAAALAAMRRRSIRSV